MIRALITGSEGFVGKYLRTELEANGRLVMGMDRIPAPGCRQCDLNDAAALMQAIRPLICFSNYHHKETKGGRQLTRRVAEAIGALVLQNWLHGEIYIDCQGNTITVTCSKGNIKKVFKI